MDHTFRLSRAASSADAEERTASVIADADKLLKQYQARHPGAHARLQEGDGEHVRVTIAVPEDADEAHVLAVFAGDAERLGLIAERH